MSRYFNSFSFSRRSRHFSFSKHCLIIALLLCSLLYILLKIKIIIDYHNAHSTYQTFRQRKCLTNFNVNGNHPKVILFWTKIFSQQVNERFLNEFLFQHGGRCATQRCRVTVNRYQLCRSDAVIFHARGGIKSSDMPEARLPSQRYVLLTKEPPYKTTAIVGYLNNFFNWTATVNV